MGHLTRLPLCFFGAPPFLLFWRVHLEQLIQYLQINLSIYLFALNLSQFISLRIYEILQTSTLSPLARGLLQMRTHLGKSCQIGLKPALIEKCWLPAFIVTYKPVPAVGLGFTHLHVHNVIPSSFATDRRLFQNVYYQTLPSGTCAILLLTSDYNAITVNVNRTEQFIRYSHYQLLIASKATNIEYNILLNVSSSS